MRVLAIPYVTFTLRYTIR